MRRILAAIALGALVSPALARAQSAAAKAAFENGEAARKTGDYAKAAQEYRRAIELDPDYADAHQNYTFVSETAAITPSLRTAVFSGKATQAQEAEFEKEENAERAKLEARYKQWAAEHPNKAIYLWVLGSLNDEDDPGAALRYYQAAIKRGPQFAPAYQSLSLMDEVRGDLPASREDLHKAVLADPKSPAYLFYYAFAFQHSDPARYQALAMEVVKRFPESDRAAQSLYWLADSARTDSQKLHYLLMLKADKAPKGQDWRSSGMEALFDVYMRTDRAQALALAQEMLKADPKDTQWTTFSAYAQAMVAAERMIHEGHPTSAVATLDKVSLPSWYQTPELALLRAGAQSAAGNNQEAYQYLLKNDAVNPTDQVHSALIKYGRELGKNPAQVDADVWALVEKGAHAAVAFSLPAYAKKGDMSLADFRGHVILLNFWYPECGPCRGEFPYIQGVLDKYKARGFEIVAVNVSPQQNDLVLPLLKGFKLGFIPLQGSDKWAMQAYHVRGEPTNFLIGSDGRVYFGPLRPVSSPEAERTLELQVSELLQHGKT